LTDDWTKTAAFALQKIDFSNDRYWRKADSSASDPKRTFRDCGGGLQQAIGKDNYKSTKPNLQDLPGLSPRDRFESCRARFDIYKPSHPVPAPRGLAFLKIIERDFGQLAGATLDKSRKNEEIAPEMARLDGPVSESNFLIS
jgi:hypothetical protein